VVKEKQRISTDKKAVGEKSKKLILLNDDVNTFDHVIESLIEICNHSEEQAEQCALVTHLKGKCPVKNGNQKELMQLKVQLSERLLSTVISE
jgi:ATP-dependent Clp protease adaptor protein ClpS